MAALTAEGFDFSATAPTGQRIYFEKNGTSTVKVVAPANNNWGDYEMPAGSLTIPASVTYDSKTYTVTTIGLRAFVNDTLLTSVTLQEGITSIDMMAFSGCKYLASIKLPNSIERIAFSCFDGTAYFMDETNWNSHHSLIIGNWLITQANLYSDTVRVVEGIVGLANSSFLGCEQIPKVVLPSSLKYLGENTFRDCYAMDTVQLYSPTPPKSSSSTFAGLFDLVALVPCGASEAYDTSSLWQTLNVVEMPCDSTPVDPTDSIVPINPWPGGPVIGIDEAEASKLVAFTTTNGLTISGAEGLDLTVYDIKGIPVASLRQARHTEYIPLPASGLYIVVPSAGNPLKINYLK